MGNAVPIREAAHMAAPTSTTMIGGGILCSNDGMARVLMKSGAEDLAR